MQRIRQIFLFVILGLHIKGAWAQESPKIDFSTIKKTEIVKLNYDVLLDLPLSDLKKLAEIAGITTDELLQLSLNQEVSTASKKGESLFESPLSASVISKEEIVLSGATTIVEALRLVQGLIVRQESNGNFDVHIRGNDNVPPGNMAHFSENTLSLVMIDNRIVYNYINGGIFWESLPVGLSDIERIEIIRGPASSLYGPNAVSGVIHIITKKPVEKGIKVNGDFQAGNFNTKVADISVLSKFTQKIQCKFTGSADFRDRTMTEFYEFLRQQYLPSDSLISMFGNRFEGKSTRPELAKEALSTTAELFYCPSTDIFSGLQFGIQKSKAQSVFFENLATPLSIRSSETSFIDYKIQAFNLSAQVNFLTGNQNLHEMMLKPVVHYDYSFLTGNLEYELNLHGIGVGELTIRPGINFQEAKYDDSKYIELYRKEYSKPDLAGLLNGERTLNTISGNLRIDYKPVSKIRIIGSFRGDKFNYPNKTYISYQLGVSYNFNSNHIIRAVASKANRSAFMGDVYADYKNLLMQMQGLPLYQIYAGFNTPRNANDYKLLTQFMYEVGYRGMVTDNFQVDLEFFSTITDKFSALMPSNRIIEPNNEGQMEILDVWAYQNMDVKSLQYGSSWALSYSPVKKMNLKLFGSIHKTTLHDIAITLNQDFLITAKAKNTPTLYGGITLNYNFLDRWNINSSVYYLSEQTYSRYQFQSNNHQSMEIELDSKIIANLKIAYRVYANNTVFLNIRNLSPDTKPEFGYADKINALFMVGTNLSF